MKFSPTDSIKQSYSKFRKKYFSRPADFIRDCIIFEEDEAPAEYQLEIVNLLFRKNRVSVRGPHGLGKTALASWIILWYALTRDVDKDWKIATTASAWRQLTHFLWPEIRKWSRRLDWNKIGRDPFNENKELLSRKLKLESGEAFALASDDPAAIEGAHAKHMLYLFDESKTIPEETWDAAEGAMSTGFCHWLSISTPGEPQGRFFDIQSRKEGLQDWEVRHVTMDEAIHAGQMGTEWAYNRLLQWGEKSAVYQNRVKGEFAQSESDAVIPLSWIEAANIRWEELKDSGMLRNMNVDQIGIDVARQGEDDSVLAFRSGDIITGLETYHIDDTMQLTGQIVPFMRKWPTAHANVDVIGIGAGVFDRLKEQFQTRTGYFNGRERTDMVDRSETWAFVDKRSAAYWRLRESLDPAYDSVVALPPDDKLIGDLTSPKWEAMSNGRIQVEHKKDIYKRLKRSTDTGDAVVYAFWAEAVGGDIEFG